MRHVINKTPYGTRRIWIGCDDDLNDVELGRWLQLHQALRVLSCWGNSDARLENFCDTGIEFVGFEISEENLAYASIKCLEHGSIECNYHPSTGLVPCQR